jgi:hypothetical protein
MRRDCGTAGHVVADDDPECIACGELVTTADVVGLHFARNQGALGSTSDIATVAEWGPARIEAP